MHVSVCYGCIRTAAWRYKQTHKICITAAVLAIATAPKFRLGNGTSRRQGKPGRKHVSLPHAQLWMDLTRYNCRRYSREVPPAVPEMAFSTIPFNSIVIGCNLACSLTDKCKHAENVYLVHLLDCTLLSVFSSIFYPTPTERMLCPLLHLDPPCAFVSCFLSRQGF